MTITKETAAKIKENINFANGNVRSLAMGLAKFVKSGKTDAWNIAKKVAERNINFTKDDLAQVVDEMIQPDKINAKGYITDPELLKIAGDHTMSKNERFRILWRRGSKVSEISNTMDVSYQRVQNIIKKLKKSA